MILYLIHDTKLKSYSHPMVGPDLPTVKQSLNELNPENLHDLKIISLDTFMDPSQLLDLRFKKTKKYFAFPKL